MMHAVSSIARPLVTFSAVASAAGLFACGPSFQAIYEGNVRFEHCYALEENAQAPMPKKAACWREWSEQYTYGQTRDRIQYATARYVALSQAPSLPTDEAMMMAAPGEAPRLSSITAPAPTNAFAPPPKTLDSAAPSASPAPNDASRLPMLSVDAGAGAAKVQPALPAATCSDTCGSAYRGSCDGCDSADAGAAAKACQECTKTYRTCMRGCFK